MKNKEYYPLTPSQERMFIIKRLNKESTAYNSPIVRRIKGDLNIDGLGRAFKRLLQRHESLRTGFFLHNGEPVQRLCKINIEDFSLRYWEDIEENKLQDLITHFIQPFDLEKPPLLRAGIIRLSDRDVILLVDMHHIISDLKSEDILVRDLLKIYGDIPLPELKGQYKEYAHWCRKNVSGEHLKEKEQYWIEQFRGDLPTLNLLTDFPRPPVFSFRGNCFHCRVTDKLTQDIMGLAKEKGFSLDNIFLTAFFILLHKYTDQEDVIIGTPREKRPGKEFENVIGLFINTLPIRCFPEREKTFSHLLREVSEKTKRALDNFDYDIGFLIDTLKIKRDPARNPLYDTLFFSSNLESETIGALEVSPFEFIHEKAEFDLTIGVQEIDHHLHFSIEYDSDIFKPGTIQRMSCHYQNILKGGANRSDIRLCDIEILSVQEKKQLEIDFNNTHTHVDYLAEKTIHGLFQEQVAKKPDNLAVVFGDRSVTYKELNERANQLARRLKKNSASTSTSTFTGAAVCILVEPNLDRIVSILGVLKSDSPYLPIDPAYPGERIDYMLKDSNAKILLTQTHLIKRIAFKYVINVEKEKGVGSKENLESRSRPGSPAYIIYTSGSTGRPKGTLIEHGSVINLGDWHNKTFSVTPDDRAARYAGFGFDASVWEIFPYMFKGASLHIIDPGTRLDPWKLNDWLNRNKISIAFLPTRMAEAFMKLENTSLRILLTGGDKLKKYRETGYVLVNNYGVTEGTVVSTSFFVKRNVTNIPIGKPISNTRIYILNRDKKLQPIGVPGELWLSGPGLARGYLNNPELTAERFNKSYRSYRSYNSGDLARWLPDGNIEFLGRIDNQVKIRGYRIEPEEIERILKEYPAIKDAVVLANDFAGETILAAYVVLWEEGIKDKAFDIREIRPYLKESLPEWMIPKRCILLDSIPLTPNGKTDQSALPEPDESDLFLKDDYIPPENEIEEKLVNLWQEILKVKKIGITDNFFDLGGHSLKATRLSVTIEKEFKTGFPLLDIFRKPTIKEIALLLEGNRNNREGRDTYIPFSEKQSYYPLTPSEIMIYILRQSADNNLSYHSVFPMILEGPVDKDRLNEAIKTMVGRHEAFRTGYEIVRGEPVKIIHEQADFHLEYRERNEKEIESIIDEMKQPYDLCRPPLFRAILVKLSREKHLCVIANHHIVSDGVTEVLLMKEISALYQGKELKEVKLQYKDFTMWQKKLLESGALKKQEQYWLNKFKGEIPILNIPLDYPRPPQFLFEGRTLGFQTDKGLTKKLYNIAKKNNATLFMVLLAAYVSLLYRYTGQEDIIVGSPIANRHHPDVQEVTGILLNMIAIRTFPKPGKTFRQFLKEVRVNALADYNNQEYPFGVLIDRLALKRDVSRNPLFNTIFVLQNMESEPAVLNIEGLKTVPYPYREKSAKFDISVEVVEGSGEIEFNVEYCTKLFKEATIQRLCVHFKNLLYEMVNHFEKGLCEIEILSGREKKRLLFDFNNTASDYPYDKTIPKLFEEQAARMGDRVAVVGSMSITYRELDKKSNQLTGILIEKGVRPDTIVGLLGERSLEMVVGILGILKAGGAYLPIDPDYPTGRKKYMLSDSSVDVLVLTRLLSEKIDFKKEKIYLEDYKKTHHAPCSMRHAGWTSASNLAYIIYTSGTTGKPKGVMIEHRNVVRLLFNDHFQFDFTNEDTWAMFHSYCFDFSVWEMYGALLYGGRLVLVSKILTQDLKAYAALLRREQVTVLNQTPSAFMQIMEEALSHPDNGLRLRYVIFGGEALQPGTLHAWHTRHPECKLINMYGITETTVHVTFKEITDHEITHNISNIGKPIPTLSTHVMDRLLHLVPMGVPGELCVGGDGVGQGYMNRPELTAEKFVMNPYKPRERIYRSGDLAKRLKNGEMVHIGRLDRQVKIRGFRIELGEIESLLSNHEALDQCVITVYESDSSDDKHIVAYYTARQWVSPEELKTYLSAIFPHYMIPVFFIKIDKIPITVNGKIDYQALPFPGRDSLKMETHAAPRNDTEKMLADTWSDVLKLGKPGIFDNFFEMGGHSLKAFQMVRRLKKKGYNVSVNDIYHQQTIARLASLLHKKEKSVPSKANKQFPGNSLFLHMRYPNNGFSLSAVQQRFFQRQLNNIDIFNTPFLVELKHYIEPGIIENALKEIVTVHNSLLLRFQKESDTGKWYQFYGEFPPTKYFRCIDLSGIDKHSHNSFISDYCAKLQQQFNILKGPLFKVVLFDNYCLDRRQVLFLVFHHLSFDGVSLNIFLEDLKNHCLKSVHNHPVDVETMIYTASYRDWCLRLEEYSRNGSLQSEKEYWINILKEGRSFPVDTMPDKWACHKDMEHFRTNVLKGREEVEKLFLAIRTYRCSVLALLLASLYSACRGCKNQTDLLLHIMSNQRESFFPEIAIHRTIGFFAGAYPVRIRFNKGDGTSFDHQKIINLIKTSLFNVPRGGLDYFVIKYLLPAINNTQSDLIDPSHMLFHFMDRHRADDHADDFYLPLEIPFGSTSYSNNKSAYLLNMTAVLGEQSLDLTCYYSTLHYRKDTILEFSKAFVSHLKKVIGIGISPRTSGVKELQI